ncbi:pyridoxamine 5'-phosphate oxidase family protein [Streptomyces sp. NPDC090108]|uniref:pyridoxamine 5'-phosphate oxidase family protein n=1 Tax=Streptomyces sp. NPDC090108 TaxID=3365947 RepID=UPI00382F415E
MGAAGVPDVYHAGSRALQDLAGVRERADHVGRSLGRDIKPVAAAFLELQPLLIVGAAAPDTGRVWAAPLAGAPGFVRATGPGQMSVTTGPGQMSLTTGPGRPSLTTAPGRTPAAGPVPGATAAGQPSVTAGTAGAAGAAGAGGAGGELSPGGPLALALATPGTRVGTLALDPRTRRRMRLNGRLRPTSRGFAVEADQVFANCPRYIQRRESFELLGGRTPGLPRRTPELTPEQVEFVESADTFFLATVHGAGADVSHRGGNPGFVTVASPRELTWPDYPGNAMFLTLGNLRTDPRAGLLLLDWTTGTTLQLTGEAHTGFGPDGARTVRFTVTEVLATEAAVPLRWSAPEYSPANPATAR